MFPAELLKMSHQCLVFPGFFSQQREETKRKEQEAEAAALKKQQEEELQKFMEEKRTPCNECGYVAKNKDAICPSCGLPLPEVKREKTEEKSKVEKASSQPKEDKPETPTGG